MSKRVVLKTLKKQFDDVREIYEKSYSKEELENIISEFKDLNLFKYNKTPSEAYYFNLKLYLIKDKVNSFNRFSKQIEDSLDESKRSIDEIKRERINFEPKFKAINVPEELRISREFYSKIKDISIDGDLKEIEVSSLYQLKEKLKEETSKLRKKFYDANDRRKSLKGLIKREDNLLKEINEQKKLLEIIDHIFDTEFLKSDKDNFKKRLTEIISYYEGNTETLIKNINEFDDLSSRLGKNLSSLKNAWAEYIKKQKGFLNDHKKVLECVDVDDEKRRSLSNILNEFKNKLDENIENQRVSAKELEDLRANIKKEFEDRLKPYLDQDELNLLKTINSIRGKGIIDYEMIKEKASENNINFEKAHKGLINKGYIKLGFYFPK